MKYVWGQSEIKLLEV